MLRHALAPVLRPRRSTFALVRTYKDGYFAKDGSAPVGGGPSAGGKLAGTVEKGGYGFDMKTIANYWKEYGDQQRRPWLFWEDRSILETFIGMLAAIGIIMWIGKAMGDEVASRKQKQIDESTDRGPPGAAHTRYLWVRTLDIAHEDMARRQVGLGEIKGRAEIRTDPEERALAAAERRSWMEVSSKK